MRHYLGILGLVFIITTGTGISAANSADREVAIFAGGCFWCVESDFDHVRGVVSTISGYTGGNTQNPTYRNHSAGRHREAVKITFDPGRVTYRELTRIFFRSINPVDGGGQFCDRGHSYTTAIYALDGDQLAQAREAAAEASKTLGKRVVTAIISAGPFWPAEDYHQNYYKKNAVRYGLYRRGCRRDAALRQLWGREALSGIAGH